MSITLALCIITGIISFQGFNNPNIVNSLKHYPVAEHQNKEYYRMLSSGFVHGGWMHLLINLFVLYQFGPIVEKVYGQVFGEITGPIMYLFMYLATIVVADLPTFFRHRNNPAYAAVGASGAVSGVVFIYILFFPWAQLSLYGIIPFRAIVGGVAYLIYSSWASKNRQDGIDHSAHFYGAVFGMLLTIAFKPSLLSHFINELTSGFPF
ncbi:MAG: rhomboid family intramembrane serine protease [Saprospiraceae bacterium]|nr:rhomboid family intramembrane serine protease [Bacteroidia bacterium]NNK90418.1 rhomboid family intramembrane serine protease [Saprospiraceae bacterium]